MYLAAGYARSAGIEIYLLHYATEMRRRGFDTRIVVFESLPAQSHWCLNEVRGRGISIRSLSEERSSDLRLQTLDHRPVERQDLRATVPPSNVYGLWSKVSSGALRVRRMLRGKWRGPTDAEMERWQSKRRQIQNLREMIRKEKPDIIHVKGRIIAEAWDVLPPERTIFHVATSGACDDSWTRDEVARFRPFIERCAAVLAPGSGVADRFKREFGIQRDVDVVFTMAPDEAGEGLQTTDHGLRTTDHGLPAADPAEAGPRTTDDRLQTEDSGLQISGRRGCPSSVVRSLWSVIRFGFVGRLVAGKGIVETVEALALLRHEGIEPPFVFVGDGPLAGELRDAITRAGLTHATMAGVLPPREAVKRMDVLVLASESEAMPLVLVEALSAGHPCVATAVGGIPDLIRDGVEGVLLQDGTPATIADGIRRMSAMSPDVFGAMSSRARARYEQCCTPERVGAVVEKHYRKVIG
jgi:hypothetical protein